VAELRRQLHYRMKGSMGNDEDWWVLVFDPEARKLYVEHEWDNVPLSGGKGTRGKRNISIGDFLQEGGQGKQHSELVALIEAMFEDNESA